MARPSMPNFDALELDTPGNFFRMQKEDQNFSEAASKLLEGGGWHHPHDGQPPV